MALDPVHDIQSAYRKVVRAMAYPGTIVDLSPEASKIEPAPPFNPTVMLLILMLLDREVTVAFSPDFPAQHGRLVSELTYARLAAIETARYIVCTDSSEEIGTALRSASSGTLIDPHLGATVIAQVLQMAPSFNGNSQSITLTGPGIEESTRVSVSGAEHWIDDRNAQTADYPLGVDLLIVDALGRLLAMPRTTRAVQGAAKWDT